MFLFLLNSFSWASPDTELGIYTIEGSDNVLLREQIYSSLTKALIQATVHDSYWIVSEAEQRRRLRKLEEDWDCTEDCALSTAEKIGLDKVILGSLAVHEEAEKQKHYVLTLDMYDVPSKKLLSHYVLDEIVESVLIFKMSGVAQELLQEKVLSEPENIVEQPVFEAEKTVVQETSKKISVHVDSTPSGAVVLLDGTLVCRETPCTFVVHSGSHNLSIQQEDYEPYQQSVLLTADTTISQALSPTFAEVSINGQSEIELLFDDQPVKILPIFNKQISEGSHIISVNDTCYFREDYKLEAIRGNQYSIDLALQKRMVPISIHAQDSFQKEYNVEIFVDGELIGTSPFTGEIPLCSTQLEAKLVQGKNVFSQQVDLTLYSKSNEVIISVPDGLEAGSQSVSFNWGVLFDKPIWYASAGYQESTHTASSEPRFLLSSGYIQPISDGYSDGIYNYSVPADLFLNETALIGVGVSFMGNKNHLFSRIDIDYGISGQLYYYAPEANGFPLMVYSPDVTNFSLSFGLMPMFHFFRPFAGIRVQGGIYTMDILDVETDSEYLSSYDLSPYTLVSTDYNNDISPIRPKLQLGHLSIGATGGWLLYFAGADFLLGIEQQYSYMFSTMGTIYQVDTALIFGNRFK